MLYLPSMMSFVKFVGNVLRAKSVPKSLSSAVLFDAQFFPPSPSNRVCFQKEKRQLLGAVSKTRICIDTGKVMLCKVRVRL